MRARVHLGFAGAFLAAAIGGGLLWSRWGAAALLNGFAAICG